MTSLKTKNIITKGYNIKEELIIRKKLENITAWNIEFNENYENRYDYDLCYFKHIIDDNEIGYKKDLIGFVEVEVSPQWDEYNIPENWYEISFLKRKCFNFNFNLNKWTDEPKENYKKTIYLKSNKYYTNCFAVNIQDIIDFSENSNRNDNSNSYKNSFLSMGKDHDKIKWGWDEIKILIDDLI